MKILVISQYYSPEPFRINDICEELANKGHVVTVLTGQPNYPDGEIYDGYKNGHEEEIINGVKVIRCKIRPRKKGSLNLLLNYISFWRSASQRIKKLNDNYDVVYSYQLSPISSVAPANWYSKKHKIPHFLYCLDIWPESIIENINPNSPVYYFIKRYSKKQYLGANTIGVTSPSFTNYLKSLTGLSDSMFVYIPQHAKDLTLIKKEKKDRILNIVFTGNIGESQNLDVLIDAVSSLKDNGDLSVTIVGSGSEQERLMKKVNNLGLSNLIVFTGRQPKTKMPDYYKLADICFLSLRDEGAVSWTIPGKLQEYMSAGRPILAAVSGDARFVIEDAKCGICVDYNDSNELAKTIKNIIANRDVLIKYGENARAYFLEHFTLQQHIDNLEIELTKLVCKPLMC